MTFTDDEKRLLYLYYSGSVAEAADNIRDALADITDPDERSTALELLRKLEGMSETEFDCLDPESGVLI